MMKHAKIEKNLIAFIDGSIDGRLKNEIRDHLSACPGCSAKLALLNGYWGAKPEESRPSPGPYLWQGIESRINSPYLVKTGKAHPAAGRHLLRFSAAALIMIASILLGNYIGNVPEATSGPVSTLPENQYLVRNYHLDSFSPLPDESIGLAFQMTSERTR